MRRLRSAVAALRLEGLKGAADLLRSNVYAPGTCLRLRLDLNVPIGAGRRGCPDLRVISGDLGSLTAWRQPQWGHTLPPDFFADQTYGLQQFHLGLCRGAVAGILWFAGPGEATTISNWRLARGEIEVRNVRTLSEFQRQGLFHCMARTALRSARAQGVTAAYAHVDEHNVASRNAFMALGFHPTHRLKMLRVLGVDRIRESVL